MNKQKINSSEERRKTRSILRSPEEESFLNSNFIDNYSRKKKKINSKLRLLFIDGIINDLKTLTKIKFEMPRDTTESADSSLKGANEAKEKEEEQKEENIFIPIEEKNSIKESIQLNSEQVNKIEDSANKQKEETPQIINSESGNQKDKNLIEQDFSTDNAVINITPAKTKKVNKRYQELLENSLLVFDRPQKNKFSVIKSNTHESGNIYPESLLGGFEANLIKELNLNPRELELNLKFNDHSQKKTQKIKSRPVPNVHPVHSAEKKVKSKIGANSAKFLEQNETTLSNIPLNYHMPKPKVLNTELLKIYNDLNQIKLLGKKRINNFKLDTYFTNTKNNIIEQQIEGKSTHLCEEINPYSITKQKLKENFLNPIYENLLKTKLNILGYNSNTQKSENTYWADINIVNQFDLSLRREFASVLDFQKKFNEDYAPIQMQKENEKIFQNESLTATETSSVYSEYNNIIKNHNSDSISKTHFIKKKQSAVNIKRQCGVSYVVASESRQKDVGDKYHRLGHLVYQGTYAVSQSSDPEVNEFITLLIESQLMHRPLLVSYFESADEEEMKDYLLYPHKRGSIAKDVYLVDSLDEIWKFAKEKFFLCIHLVLDNRIGIRNFTQDELEKGKNNLISISNAQIGFLFRKATSGVKSVLKLYKNGGLDNVKHPSTFKLSNIDVSENVDSIIEKLSGTNMPTLSMRIELYVGEATWKCADIFTQQFLYSFMCGVEETITKLILNWNEYRNQMHVLTKEGKNLDSIDNTQIYILERGLFNDGLNKNEVQISNYNLAKDKLIKNINQVLIYDSARENKFETSNIVLTKLNVNDRPSSRIFNIPYFNPPLPLYIISTRDCFVFDLNVRSEIININDRQVLKKEYFFHENTIPNNFHKFKTSKSDLRVGVVTYEDFFSSEELSTIENDIERTEEYSVKEAFLPETAQKTFAGEKLKRTKFFFGSRYMWTKKQLAEPNSYVAAGIRKDVSPPPYWMKDKIEAPLVKAGIIKENFINSFALNVYHDGSEGLGQHFDDAVRFKQPIFTLRLFSDCRLSFGSQLYGFCNGAFTIPLPRGCVCVMEENSYASNGVKHCIRPCDMTGKSSALILRQMHPSMVNEADRYDYLIDFPSWFSALSIHEQSMPYYLQKTKESEFLIKLSEMEKKSLSSRTNPNINEEVISSMNDILNTLDLYNESKYNFQEPTTKKGRKKLEY